MLAGRLPWKNLPEGVFVDHPELKVIGSWCHGDDGIGVVYIQITANPLVHDYTDSSDM